MTGERIYFEAEDVIDTLIKFIGTDDYKTMLECTYGTDKESGFRAGLMMVPSILMAKCKKFYEVGLAKEDLKGDKIEGQENCNHAGCEELDDHGQGEDGGGQQKDI